MGRPRCLGALSTHGGGTLVRALTKAFGALLLAVAMLGPLAPPASAEQIVSPVPGRTPSVIDGQVYALAKVGDTVIVGGTFSQASSWRDGTVLSRSRLLAFDATTGVIDPDFAPELNGGVRSLVPGPTAGTVIAGGAFSKLAGKSVGKVVMLNLNTGARVTSFKSPAMNGKVLSLAAHGNRLFVGGNFATVGGVAHKGIASLNLTTGALDPFVGVQLSQRHNDSGSGAQSAVGVMELDVTPDGSRVVAIGNFKQVDGLPRDQVVMLDTSGAAAVVSPDWATQRYTPYCAKNAFDSYVRDVSFSPDGSFFVVGASGGPFAGTLCDAAARFETYAVGGALQPTWVDYTGGDTLWGVEVTDSAVYVGGHMRWMNNINGRDSAGQGAVPRPGIAALSTDTGLPLDWNPGRHPRGEAVYTLLATDNGLYFGSDTDYIGNFAYTRPRIGFFPLAGGHQEADDSPAALPADVLTGSPGLSGDSLVQQSYDGTTFGARTTLPATGIAWSKVRGAFFAGGKVFYGYDDGFLYSRTYRKGVFGDAVKLDPYHDPDWLGVPTGSGSSTYTGAVPSLFPSLSSYVTGLAYHNHRLYYTQSNSTSLQWRYFNADSGIVGSEVFTASNGIAWNDAALSFAAKGALYYASRSTGQLRRVALVDNAPSGSVTTVDASRDWRGRATFLAPPIANESPVADFTQTCLELACDFQGGASADPDGTIASWDWDFGDGTTGTGPAPQHTFATGGDHQVRLTVTDDQGATGTVTRTVSTIAPAASHIAFIDSAGSGASVAGTSATVTVPAGVQAGDTLVLYGSFALTDPGVGAVDGWQVAGTRSVNGMYSRVWTRTAGPGTAGSAVTVPWTTSTKSALTLAAYRDASATLAAGAIESAVDSASTTHTAPMVTAPSGAWLLSFWSDKSSRTTGWSTPASEVLRATTLGTGSGRVTAVLADSGARVPTPGTWGGREATTAEASTRAISWTIALSPAP